MGASSAFSISTTVFGETCNPFLSTSSSSSSFSVLGSPYSVLSGLRLSKGGDGVVAMAARETNSRLLTGVIFEPFEEVKKELQMVPNVPQDSIARQKFGHDSEAAINEQIKWVFLCWVSFVV